MGVAPHMRGHGPEGLLQGQRHHREQLLGETRVPAPPSHMAWIRRKLSLVTCGVKWPTFRPGPRKPSPPPLHPHSLGAAIRKRKLYSQREAQPWNGRSPKKKIFLSESVSRFANSVTPWTPHGAHQAPLSMEFSRQEYWSGLPFPSPGDLPDPWIEPTSPALHEDSLPLSQQRASKLSLKSPQGGKNSPPSTSA